MINIPFNFQPTSVTVKNTSYSVPSGSYAFVTAIINGTGNVTIDGTTALTGTATTSGAIFAVSQASAYTVPSGYRFEGQVTGTVNGTNVTVGGVKAGHLTNATTDHVNVKAADGDQVTVSSGTPSVTGYELREHEEGKLSVGSFWLPAGATVAGTGNWEATFSLYDEIS